MDLRGVPWQFAYAKFFFAKNMEAVGKPKLSFKLGIRRQIIALGSCSS